MPVACWIWFRVSVRRFRLRASCLMQAIMPARDSFGPGFGGVVVMAGNLGAHRQNG